MVGLHGLVGIGSVMAWSGVKVRLLHGGIGALGVAGFAEVEEV